jgi:hypothetical protein
MDARESYVRLSVSKLTMVEMKFSRIMMLRMDFQSVVSSPRSRQIDSRVSLTPWGGLFKFLISTKFCFLMDFTATEHCLINRNIDDEREQTLLSFFHRWFDLIQIFHHCLSFFYDLLLLFLFKQIRKAFPVTFDHVHLPPAPLVALVN